MFLSFPKWTALLCTTSVRFSTMVAQIQLVFIVLKTKVLMYDRFDHAINTPRGVYSWK